MPLKGIGLCKGCKEKPQRLANSKSIKFRAAPESTNAMTEKDDNEQIRVTDKRNLGCIVLMVCVHSLGGIKLALLVREEYEYFISNVHTSTVRTGISNTLGIRGAVGVSFNFNLDVLQCIYSGQHQLLLPVDQLNQEREKKKIFLGFKEHPIAFPPTCRYERGSRSYDLQKAKKTGTRIFSPSWSDRILWTSYPGTEVKCTSYDCTDDIVTSDHSPVFSTFEVGLRAFPQGDCRYSLKFLSIEAIIKTQSRSQGYIEFRSLCLKGAPQSSVNSAHNSEGAAFLKLGWSEQDLPELTLVEDLTQPTCAEHILLSIRPTDGGDSPMVNVVCPYSQKALILSIIFKYFCHSEERKPGP
ncbi:unnamed protein product [Ranitomeya imitator]|uniref:Inositol polyphosphate-related phosphatase domain-containing protein n=1 Tax=Ranitomeya imitator TaxID=111125 RepID=A0ABN9MCN0_9NEOB|nr:unnamed protein product [Ranitomeya imitator]